MVSLIYSIYPKVTYINLSGTDNEAENDKWKNVIWSCSSCLPWHLRQRYTKILEEVAFALFHQGEITSQHFIWMQNLASSYKIIHINSNTIYNIKHHKDIKWLLISAGEDWSVDVETKDWWKMDNEKVLETD